MLHCVLEPDTNYCNFVVQIVAQLFKERTERALKQDNMKIIRFRILLLNFQADRLKHKTFLLLPLSLLLILNHIIMSFGVCFRHWFIILNLGTSGLSHCHLPHTHNAQSESCLFCSILLLLISFELHIHWLPMSWRVSHHHARSEQESGGGCCLYWNCNPLVER